MIKDISPIQNHILSRLKNAASLRYSDLRPETVPNDLFNYHLQQLVKKGYLNRKGDGYSLADKGVRHVADPYTKNDAITSLFKVNVITMVSRGKGKSLEVLQQVRKSNPSYGKIGIPGGVVLKGEGIEPAATRKLRVETGLEAQFRLVGMERRIMYRGGELFSDLLFPIAYADSYTGELIVDTDFGHNMWVPIDEAIRNESAEYDSLHGIVTALKAIKSGKISALPFYFEENVQSDTVDKV